MHSYYNSMHVCYGWGWCMMAKRWLIDHASLTMVGKASRNWLVLPMRVIRAVAFEEGWNGIGSGRLSIRGVLRGVQGRAGDGRGWKCQWWLWGGCRGGVWGYLGWVLMSTMSLSLSLMLRPSDVQAWLGLKASGWAWLSRAWACNILKPSPKPSTGLGLGLAWA